MLMEVYEEGSNGALIDSFDAEVVPHVGSILVLNIVDQENPDRYRVVEVEHLFLTHKLAHAVTCVDTKSVSVRCFVQPMPRP